MDIATTLERLQHSDLSHDLKQALTELVAAGEAMLAPGSAAPYPWRLKRQLAPVVESVLAPETSVHWWELVLALLEQYAPLCGQEGQHVLQAAANLRPLLQAHFGPNGPVTLEKITEDTVIGVCLLSDTLLPPQSHMVALNVMSLAQAHFNPHAWFRAIYAGRAPVGFIMIVDDDQTPEYFLWRFMLARPYQGRGYGRQAIDRLIDYVRTRPGGVELGVSCGQGEGSPEGFYRQMGFIPTGEVDDDEVVLKMKL